MREEELAKDAISLGFGTNFEVLPFREYITVRIVAPHFVAGIELEDGVCYRAAPILAWCKGRARDDLRSEFKKRGWRASVLPKAEP